MSIPNLIFVLSSFITYTVLVARFIAKLLNFTFDQGTNIILGSMIIVSFGALIISIIGSIVNWCRGKI